MKQVIQKPEVQLISSGGAGSAVKRRRAGMTVSLSLEPITNRVSGMVTGQEVA